jgi:hypothetical protein
MRDAEDGIAFGDYAFTFREISVEEFCQDDDSEEDDSDGDASDEGVAPRDAGAKVQLWQKNIVPSSVCASLES